MIRTALVGLVVSMFAQVLVGQAWAGQTTNYGLVTQFLAGWNGVLIVIDGTAAQNLDGCDDNSAYLLRNTTANYQVLASTLMTARVSGMKVKFWTVDCSNGGTSGYPDIRSVYLGE